GEVEAGRGARQEPSERVDLDDVPVDGDAGPARTLGIGADRGRVAAEARVVEDDVGDDEEAERDVDRRVEPEDLAAAEVAREARRNRSGKVRPAVDQVAEPEGHPEGAEGDDERGQL